MARTGRAICAGEPRWRNFRGSHPPLISRKHDEPCQWPASVDARKRITSVVGRAATMARRQRTVRARESEWGDYAGGSPALIYARDPQESEGATISCETAPLLSELIKDPESATGSQPACPEAFGNCELSSAFPAVAVYTALREPSRLPLRSPVSRISRGAARFPGRSNKLRFPVACPNPWSPRRSPKFVFRLPGAPGFPEPPEIRRASCNAGYPMLPGLAPGARESRLPGTHEPRLKFPKSRLPSTSSASAPTPFPLRFPKASWASVPSVMLFRFPGSS